MLILLIFSIYIFFKLALIRTTLISVRLSVVVVVRKPNQIFCVIHRKYSFISLSSRRELFSFSYSFNFIVL